MASMGSSLIDVERLDAIDNLELGLEAATDLARMAELVCLGLDHEAGSTHAGVDDVALVQAIVWPLVNLTVRLDALYQAERLARTPPPAPPAVVPLRRGKKGRAT
jgi:hypothetical protein